MVSTIKFSEFADGGDLSNGVTTVGLSSGTNTQFNNPWTFLAPGATGDRPVPTADIYYRQRLNTTLQTYEYYDPTVSLWIQLSGSGTGTVNPGTTNDLAFYPQNGTAVSPIASVANAMLVTNGSEVPSLSNTMPSGMNIPGAAITSSTAALVSGQVATTPVNATDIANKIYVDNQVSGGVTSITGTTNQVIASSPTGNITLSLPQDIGPGSSPTFSSLILNAGMTAVGSIQSTGNSLVSGSSAGGFTGSLILWPTTTGTGSFRLTSTPNSGNFTNTLLDTASSAARTWSLPDLSGTIAMTSQIPSVSPAALTEVNDTNVTLTLGGTPSTALLQSVSMTLGWTGLLSVTRGGTGVSSVTTTPTATSFAGWDSNKELSANNFISGYTSTVTAAGTTTLTAASTRQQYLTGTTTQTVVLPVASTMVLGKEYQLVNSSSGIVTVNSSGSNLVVSLLPNTDATITCVLTSGTTAASWSIIYGSESTDVSSVTGTANQVLVNGTSGTPVTGALTLTLPQNINTTSSPTFASLTLTSPLAILQGGTGTTTGTGSGSVVLSVSPAIRIPTILDANGLNLLTTSTVAGSVNYFQMTNSATGFPPTMDALGSDADVSYRVRTKGNGSFIYRNGSLTDVFTVSSSGAVTATSIGFGGTALANYVEGTWTPVLTGASGGSATYSNQVGGYTRIGNRVFFDIYISTSSSTLLGGISITGLPLTVGSNNFAASVWCNSMGISATPGLTCLIQQGGTSLALWKFVSGAATQLSNTDVGTAFTMVITGSYRV